MKPETSGVSKGFCCFSLGLLRGDSKDSSSGLKSPSCCNCRKKIKIEQLKSFVAFSATCEKVQTYAFYFG